VILKERNKNWDEEIRESTRSSGGLVFKGRGDKMGTYYFFSIQNP
jgi:hypothetical protein